MSYSPEERAILDELGPATGFEPFAYYEPAGDCVEFHFTNEPCYAKRLDGWVTVYYSEETGDVTGGLIKGVRRNLLERFPGLQIEIKGGSIDISLLLRAPAWSSAVEEPTRKTYQAVIDKARQLEARHPRFRAALEGTS